MTAKVYLGVGFVVLVCGCGRAEPLYNGKALSAWQLALKDKNSQVRGEAAAALGDMGEKAAPAVPDLAAALKDTDVKVRIKVATALWGLGLTARNAAPNLIESARDA